jgi:hypothetical protein
VEGLVANDDEKSSFVELAMISITALPVLGAMVSAPIVGSTLASLAILDSLKVLITGT